MAAFAGTVIAPAKKKAAFHRLVREVTVFHKYRNLTMITIPISI